MESAENRAENRPLNNAIGKEGFIFLWKLKIAGVESEEILAPLVFLEKIKDNFDVLDVAIANELIEVETVDAGITLLVNTLINS